jgi:hypothetical protein
MSSRQKPRASSKLAGELRRTPSRSARPEPSTGFLDASATRTDATLWPEFTEGEESQLSDAEMQRHIAFGLQTGLTEAQIRAFFTTR